MARKKVIASEEAAKRKRRSWTPIPDPNEEQEGDEDTDPILLPPVDPPQKAPRRSHLKIVDE
jgi:hypothetical protein